ncbi:MAG: hypothetical protein K2X04_09125 [Burkholderiales bacterium]|jgi:type 1 fimbria pilin|nr:hypothetical protein [Burkholderiales bacterium]
MQKINYSVLLSTIVLCVSCSAGDGSMPATTTSPPDSSGIQTFGFSSILQIPIVNSIASSASYDLDVLNLTDKALSFNHLDAQFIHDGRLLPDVYENSYLNVSDCLVLNPHSRCTLHYTAPEKMGDDATAYKLTFNDEQHNLYSFSRVLNSINIPAINGFYVNSSQKLNVVSDKNYTVTIPFVVSEDLQNLKLTSDSPNLVNQKLSCDPRFITKNSSCTATLEFSPGYYSADINVMGISNDQAIRKFNIILNAKTGNPNLMGISDEDLIIDNTESSTHQASLFVLNNGSRNVKNVVSSISNTSNAITDVNYQCNGQNYKQIPSSFFPGDICRVDFSVDPHSNGVFESFKVTFDQVSGTDLPSTISSKLYFINN